MFVRVFVFVCVCVYTQESAKSFGSEVPMKRAGQPSEVAPAYVFLASDVDSSYITGQVLHPNGGTGKKPEHTAYRHTRSSALVFSRNVLPLSVRPCARVQRCCGVCVCVCVCVRVQYSTCKDVHGRTRLAARKSTRAIAVLPVLSSVLHCVLH